MRFKKLCLIFAITTLSFQFAYAKNVTLEEGFSQIADEISTDQNISKNANMAVIGFQESTRKQRLFLSSIIEDDLTVYLIAKRPGKVIAKNHIDTVLSELKLTRDDIFDGKNRKQFGKLVSADLLVSGTYYINKKDLIVNVTVISIESGLAYYSKSIKIKVSEISPNLLQYEYKNKQNNQ
ncbi:MAG: hypothetical protein VB017_00145 [Endomicrobiaceae bacterium]|jgi:TolB-like protein|nr:hypothetical protein [Endomicrobiaceae bacterium]